MIGNIGYSLLTLAVWLITSLAAANSAPDRMRFQHLLTSDGDADQQGIGAIKDILQDPEGFMWFAGEFGLARYDSHVFKFFYYDAQNPNSLSSNFVSALVLDKSGTLWCGTSNGLNRYNRATENFDRYMDAESPGKPRISSNAVSSLAVDNANQLYIGTGAGLNIMSAKRDRIRRYNYNPSISNSLSSNSVRSLFIDSHQQVWVGTIGGGLNLFDPLTKGFQRWVHSPKQQGSIPTDDVERILEDHLGRIWVATSTSGLSRLSADRQTFT